MTREGWLNVSPQPQKKKTKKNSQRKFFNALPGRGQWQCASIHRSVQLCLKFILIRSQTLLRAADARQLLVDIPFYMLVRLPCVCVIDVVVIKAKPVRGRSSRVGRRTEDGPIARIADRARGRGAAEVMTATRSVLLRGRRRGRRKGRRGRRLSSSVATREDVVKVMSGSRGRGSWGLREPAVDAARKERVLASGLPTTGIAITTGTRRSP